MKLSSDTINILKNFSNINPGIVLKPGSLIRTMHPQKTIMASAVVSENFESTASIYDLSRFLATLSLFDDPDVEFTKDRFVISAGRSKVNYTYAAETMIVTPPNKDIVMPASEATFNLNWKDLDSVIKASGILQLGEIAFISNGSNISISAVDSKNPTADTYSIVVVDGEFPEFKMLIKVENLKLMANDYTITLSSKGMAHLKSNRAEYFVALEAK